MNVYGIKLVGAKVILPDFLLASRANQIWQYSGMDCRDNCFDLDHFNSYSYPVEYVYNSRGFRDQEWPETLSEAIWCFGDSFTVGLGSPQSHTWPHLLAQSADRRTINISMDGASNSWIARKCLRVIREIQPSTIVIQWSYTHRREVEDTTLSDEDRRLMYINSTAVEDIKNTIDCIKQIEQEKTGQVIHSFIPEFTNQDNKQVFNLALTKVAEHVILEFPILDLARDGKHYDIKTSQKFVDAVVQLL